MKYIFNGILAYIFYVIQIFVTPAVSGKFKINYMQLKLSECKNLISEYLFSSQGIHFAH